MLAQPLHAAASLLVGAVLFLVIAAIYRLYLHPLAKYPGPKAAALSDWYASALVGKGNLHLHIREWHARYGPIVRTGPNSLCCNTESAMHAIYGRQANVLKDRGYAAMSASRRTTNTMSAIEKDDVNFKRRVHTRFLSDQNLRSLEPRLLANVDIFLRLLTESDEDVDEDVHPRDDAAWGSSVDVSKICNWLTFDVITDFCYGESVGMLESSTNRWFFQAIRAMSWRGMMCVIQPKLYELKIDRIFLASAYRKITRVGTWAMERAQARLARGYNPDKPDLFQSMMESKTKSGRAFSKNELWTESMLLLVAGSDSTSTAMSATFFYLAHHPEKRQRLVQELHATFPNESEVTIGAKLGSCKYLAACINEAMRLVPSVPNVLPRRVQPGGITVDGEFMPSGTILGTSQYAINRNPQYFPEPDAYRPERWLESERSSGSGGGGDVELARRAFQPFGTGPRTCVGWKLAWTETNLTLAKTLLSYEMRVAANAPCCGGGTGAIPCEYGLKGYAIAVVDGPHLQFRKKLQSSS